MTETIPFISQGSAEWLPIAKASGFFLATFILEDVAAVGAGLLLAAGGISWIEAFTACFLGIWFGDAGLYALARYGGRGWFDRSSLRRFAKNVAKSESWFAQRGALILVFSRLLPGARLPTYLAAGFLRVRASRFLWLTGAASCLWTVAILFFAQTFGARLANWLGAYKHAGAIFLIFGLLLFIGWRLLRQASGNLNCRRLVNRLARWRHWEFWPAWLFYPPVIINYLRLAIKYRGLLLPTSANPGIFSGGMLGESKSETLRELFASSPEFTAEAQLLPPGTTAARLSQMEDLQVQRKIDFPLVLKPDIGQRGAGVKIVRSRPEAENYFRQTKAPVVVQRYVPGPYEIGIFYYRFPNQPRGQIFAITEKIFPKLAGDGTSTVAELIERDPRARFVAQTYLKRFACRRNEVLAAGEQLRLVEAGNHAQGCIFRDGMRFRTPDLERRIDQISQSISGFFIGRYDIRFECEEDLRAGKNFQIIELNGAASEATSIYDARNSILTAYRTLFRQWELVFAIGAANRERGCRSTEIPVLWRTWRRYAQISATYPIAD